MKKKIIGLAALILAAAAIGGLTAARRQALKALISGAKYSPEEIVEKITESRTQVQADVQSHEAITVRGLTEEEAAALAEGTVSREELIERLTEPVPAQSDSEPAAVSADGAAEPEKETYQAALSALVAEVYVLQAEYTAKLDEMLARAKAEYAAKSEGEKTRLALVKWAAQYVREATELEKECDGKIDAIAGEMLELMRENGAETDIVDELLSSYAEEKYLKKSWYISELQKRGLL